MGFSSIQVQLILNVVFFIVYFCGVWVFCSSRKHLLITLLRLEFIVLVLHVSVCAGSFGLSVLVSVVRNYKVLPITGHEGPEGE